MHTDVLIIIDPENTRHNHVLDQSSFSLGRAQSNDIVLDDNAISRHHLELQRHHNEWRILDLNSTNGVFLEDTRVHPREDSVWNRDKILRIGPYHLTWQRHDAPASAPKYGVLREQDSAENTLDDYDPNYDSAEPSNPDPVSIKLSPELVDVVPGNAVELKIEIMNLGVTADDFQIWIEELPATWYQLEQTSVRLMPRERKTVGCTLTLPHEPVRVGFYDYQVRIESNDTDYVTALAGGQLNVREYYQFDLNVTHDIRSNGTVYNITVRNEGNAQDMYTLQKSPDSQPVALTTRSNQIELLPQTQDTLHVMVEPEKRPLIGRNRTLPFELEIQASSGDNKLFKDEIPVRPYVSFIFLCWLALALALVAAIIWGLSALNSQFDGGVLINQIIALQDIAQTPFF